jgi:hypothetical protein
MFGIRCSIFWDCQNIGRFGAYITLELMEMKRDEIEKEVANLMEGRSFPAHARPSMIALLLHQNKLAIDQTCPYCGKALFVEDHGSAWTIKCPCEKSNNSFRGL